MKIPSIFGNRGARDKPKDSYGGSAYSFFFGRSTSGKNVNERTAMQTTAVYSCVRILAEAVASLPIHVYRYTETGKERVYDHPLYYLLHDEPNPEMTSFVFRETLMSHLLIWGNAYAQVIRDGNGRVLSLYPLLPDKMEVDRDEQGRLFYTYTRNTDENPNFNEYGRVRLKPEDVLHIPGLGFDGLVGYSPIAMAKNAVGMTLACEEYGASFFENGATPGGVLEHPGVLKDPAKVRESWHSVYGGSKNAGKVAVLEEGMKYQQIGIPPEEAQFLETRKFQIDEIARLYRIPPHMVGDLDKSSFSNIEQQSLEFVKYTLDPWVIRWEQSIQRALFLPQEKREYFVKMNVDGLLRGDYESRMNGYAVGRQNGWLSSNDIREMENMNLIPEEEGGNLYLINGNLCKLKDAGIFAGKGQEVQRTDIRIQNNEAICYLSDSNFFLIDAEDLWILSDHNWRIDKYGYVRCGHSNLLHRMILNPGRGKVVDHINGNPSDCRKANLRIGSQRQNSYNTRLGKNNRSGYKGVSWDKYRKKYACICVDGKTKHLGRYESKEEAADAYDRAASFLFWGICTS